MESHTHSDEPAVRANSHSANVGYGAPVTFQKVCAKCKKSAPKDGAPHKFCSHCKEVAYCGVACQRAVGPARYCSC